MDLSRTISEIDGDFSQKLLNFRISCILRPAEGVPSELGTGGGSQKPRTMGLPGRERSLKTSSAVWIQCTNVSDRQKDGQTDRQAPGDSKDLLFSFFYSILRWSVAVSTMRHQSSGRCKADVLPPLHEARCV